MSNVVHVRPKTREVPYRKHNITITYVPSTGFWTWTITKTVRRSFTDHATSYSAALREAKKLIDETLDR